MEGIDEGLAGEDSALCELVLREAPGLLRFGTAALGSAADAVALVEGVLVAGAAARASDGEACSRARLFAAVRKGASQRIEQRRRAPDAPKLVPHAMVEKLRPTEREALLLRYVADLPVPDVAAASGVDTATAHARLSRGLVSLARPSGIATDATLAPAEADAVAGRRRRAEESLAEILDGTAPAELCDFVVEDDPSRDLVHDAETAVEALRGIGRSDEFDVTGLAERVVAEVVKAREAAAGAAAEPVAETKTGPGTEPKAGTEPAPEAKPEPVAETKAGGSGSQPPALWVWARRKRGVVGASVAVAAGLVVWLTWRSSSDPTKYADAAWSGKVARISRAFGGGRGLERCSPDRAACTSVEQGDEIQAGSTLRTDGQTRAVVELKDGTRIVLDRESELLLDGGSARRARLDHGSVVAEVPAIAASRARFDLPLGSAETESAKVSFEADSSRADAEVARGSVRLLDAEERSVAIHSGEVGRLEPGRTPAVFPSPSLEGRFGWSERTLERATDEDAPIRGLGELGAKRPSDDHEKKGLVSLASHSTRVRIVGNVARTEIEEEFTSTSDDVLEGIYRFPLPPDAQIERLALDVDGKVEEGAFVDRERASSIWRGAIVNAGAKKPVGEEIVWVPGPWRDPALLEWQRGGRFELRIYPIPKRASRKVTLAYTQVIPPSGGVRRYVYPLPYDPSGSTRVGRFDVDVEVRGYDAKSSVVSRGYQMRQETLPEGARRLSFVASGFTPAGDLSIEYSLPNAEQEVTAWAYQPSPDEVSRGAAPADFAALDVDSPYVAVALRPRLPRSQDGLQRDFAIVVDASRSMFGERFRRASAVAEGIVREMDRGDRVTVLACDSTCRAFSSDPSSAGPATAAMVGDFLRGVTPEGGSDIALSIRHARESLRGAPKGAARIVYIGDGTPTIGPVGPALIRREIEASVPADDGTVTAVAIGSDADVATLTTLANAGGGVVVPYVPGQAVVEAAFAVLGATYGTTLADAEVALPEGLYDVVPGKLGTIRAGGETIVVARMSRPEVSGVITLRGKVGATPFEQRYPITVSATTSKGNAFVPRLWAAAKIHDLEEDADGASRKLAVDLSGRFHVASRYTSLLVLESEAMMQAFGLGRDQRTASWTGETVAESSGAEGESAIADKDDGQNPFTSGLTRIDELPSTATDLGSSARGAPAAKVAPPAPALPKPSYAPRAARRMEEAPASAAEAAAPEPDQPSEKRKSYDLYARDAEKADKKSEAQHGYAPPPPAATGTSGPFGGDLGRSGGGSAFATRPPVDMAGPPLIQSPFGDPPPPRFGRRYIPMRKIWERVGHIVTPVGSPVTADALSRAERDASGADPSRESLKRLYAAYFLVGNVERAGEIAERWSTKDPLDPDALTARADVAAARGDRDLAIRILGSVVDVRPSDHKALFRLARLHRWAGRAELSCRHSMAAAGVRTTDPKILVEAVRCARDLGRTELASDLMALADEPTRRAADPLFAAPLTDPSALSGDLKLEATWDGGDDVDLAMLAPDGGRVSWLGAPTRAVISARDVQSTSREGLALKGSSPGDYVVELTRPLGHRGTVRGTVSVFAAGERRAIPFVLDGSSTRVALLHITTRSRLVPL